MQHYGSRLRRETLLQRCLINVRRILYTVPSRLIGRRLEIHLYHNRLVGYFGTQPVLELARVRERGGGNRRGHGIDYRHVIEGLRRKPRAFLHCVWQTELLPTEDYKTVWAQLKTQFSLDEAARLIVEALYLAATQNQETAIAQYLQTELAAKTLTLQQLIHHFAVSEPPLLPHVTVTQHDLSSYNALISSPVPRLNPLPEPDSVAQATQSHPHARQQFPYVGELANRTALPMRIYRASSYATTVVLYQVLAGIMPPRSRPKRTSPAPKSTHRSPITQRKTAVAYGGKPSCNTASTFTNFDFSHYPDVNPAPLIQLAEDVAWLTRAQNCILLGPSGVGKTHLAASLARCCIEQGKRAKFFAATALVQQLQNRLTQALATSKATEI